MSGSPFIVTTTLAATGRVNTPPATLYDAVIAQAQTFSPGLTAQLPGSLIDDVAGTDAGTLVLIDQLVTELFANFSPYAANPYTLAELGQVYLGQGSTAASSSNTSVYVQFTGNVGVVIPPGFTVGDGTNQYAVADGGIIQTGSVSGNIFAQSLTAGSFAVPANTVTTIITSVPSGETLTVNNPLAGTPGLPAQTEAQYRAQVLQAGLVAGTGTPNILKTLLGAVPGVSAQYISVQAKSGSLWEVIVGGTGDPYAIGLAILQSGIDINTLTGSATTARNVTVSLSSYPDTYPIVFVVPAVQAALVTVTWNTSGTNYVSNTSVAALVQPAVAAYINGLYVSAPINLLELNDAFINAVAASVPENILTVLVWSVSINGTVTPPGTGTQIISGDPEGYFNIAASSVTVVQG